MDRTKLPSETMLGRSLLTNNNSYKDLLEYIITNKSKPYFTYEFKYDKLNIPVFITGQDNEKSLPFIKFPLVVKTNDVNYIVSNITGSVKSDINNSIIKNKRNDSVDFEVVRNVTIYNTLAGKDMNTLMTITAQLATIWISRTLRNQLRLDVYSEGDVEGAIYNYFIRNYIPNIKEENIRVKMLNYLSLSYKNNQANTDRVIGLLKDIRPGADMGEYVQAVCGEHPILKNIESKAIYSMVSNNWYSGSDNSNIQILLAMEDYHTMCGILFHSADTSTGSKSILGRLLKDNKRISKVDQFVDTIKGLIKDNTFM